MMRAIHHIADKAQALLGRLADSPCNLLCLMLLANALAQPYAGFSHDARLYALQVAEHVHPGTAGDDLFLRYGSQDRYSVFTLVLAPLVSAVGLDVGFFVVYLACKGLFFWGLLRLTRALVPDGPVAVLSLLYLAIVPLPFGGNEIFHLNEPFLTPRIAACGLVLLGMERMLAGRGIVAVALLAAAVPLHPLMALGGILTAAAWYFFTRLTVRQLAGVVVAVALAAGAVLAYRPLGTRLFGRLDEEWRAVLFDVCFFIDPLAWSGGDWVRILLGVFVVAIAAGGYARSRAPFLLAALATGLVGLLGSFITVRTRYLLLYQVSPYRTLWLVELLAVPLAFWGLAVLWRRGTAPALLAAPALLLLAMHDWNQDALPGVALFLGVLPVAVVAYRGLAAQPARPDWARRSSLAALLASVLVLSVYDLAVFALVSCNRPTFHLDTHPIQVLRAAPVLLFKLPELLGVVAVACGLAWLCGTGRRLRWACLLLWVGYQSVIGATAWSAWYGKRFTAGYAPRAFVAAHLRERAAQLGRTPTVYWTADLRYTWFQAGAKSYFNSVQLSGCVFNRGTAIEGKRRAMLVRRFELASLRRLPLLEPWWRAGLCNLYELGEDAAPPTAEDLFALCREEGLDFVIVEEAFDGIPCVTDGRYHIYDCRRLRALERERQTAPPSRTTLSAHASAS